MQCNGWFFRQRHGCVKKSQLPFMYPVTGSHLQQVMYKEGLYYGTSGFVHRLFRSDQYDFHLYASFTKRRIPTPCKLLNHIYNSVFITVVFIRWIPCLILHKQSEKNGSHRWVQRFSINVACTYPPLCILDSWIFFFDLKAIFKIFFKIIFSEN